MTLVALADGTVSLYLGHGGGVIGAGGHAKVRFAATELLKSAEYATDQFEPATAFGLPRVGQVRFYLPGHGTIVAADAEEATLGAGEHPMSKLFFKAHRVITAVRETGD